MHKRTKLTLGSLLGVMVLLSAFEATYLLGYRNGSRDAQSRWEFVSVNTNGLFTFRPSKSFQDVKIDQGISAVNAIPGTALHTESQQ